MTKRGYLWLMVMLATCGIIAACSFFSSRINNGDDFFGQMQDQMPGPGMMRARPDNMPGPGMMMIDTFPPPAITPAPTATPGGSTMTSYSLDIQPISIVLVLVVTVVRLVFMQRYLRGLFAGGTFCYQSQQILGEAGFAVYSNAPLDPQYNLASIEESREHTLIDMGDDNYTLGRPHPMIDSTMRNQRILSEGQDPTVAVILLDFILGFNASKDPVGELLDSILSTKQTRKEQGGEIVVVASICGTDGDPQDLNLQREMLENAGVIVFQSNARAALFCSEILKPA